jgi:hypothetical protein
VRRAERKTISNSLLAWRSGTPGERRRLRKILPLACGDSVFTMLLADAA